MLFFLIGTRLDRFARLAMSVEMNPYVLDESQHWGRDSETITCEAKGAA